ncbi:Uu.00g025800.m01.CDS01 [Anthostomella pinea]|uniref:Uu.00g025800.m01.CDS01 n=1 Tax=Anthostomella pinea TaxID=933095 RepID=A0AAI8YCJ2_9PEZI|nr:Uu.00g025800.m01.CDS01 [Anthostomella pinea]
MSLWWFKHQFTSPPTISSSRSEIESHAAAATPSFALFRHLPTELRLQIWKEPSYTYLPGPYFATEPAHCSNARTMSLWWFKHQFTSPPTISSSRSEIESHAAAATPSFALFRHLPTELRLQIWKHYFDVPRIHVVHPGQPLGPHFTRWAMTNPPPDYTEIVARTNQPTTSKQQFAAVLVSREALEIFTKTVDLAHMAFLDFETRSFQIMFERKFGDLAPPSRIATVSPEELDAIPGFREFVRNPVGSGTQRMVPPAHINWRDDLIYLTGPEGEQMQMLKRICRGPWARKVQRIALLINDRTYKNGDVFHQNSRSFRSLRIFLERKRSILRRYLQITEVILVVRLSQETHPKQRGFKRDGFGFVPFQKMNGYDGGAWDNMKVTTRFRDVTTLLQEAFPPLAQKGRIRWVVDVDCIQAEGDFYSRHPR